MSKKRGRPSDYTPEIAEAICHRIAAGESLRQVCSDEGMPPPSTVRGWVVDDRDGFSERYARARDMCVEHWADELLEIADDATNDWMERQGSDGQILGWTINGEAVQRSRIRLDTRKWLMSKIAPKRYGDKVQHTGADGAGPVVFEMNMADGLKNQD